MKCHYLDLGSASDCLKIFFNQSKHYPDLGTVTRHLYGISAVVPQVTFHVETKGQHYEMLMPFEKSLKRRHMLEGTNDMSPDLKNDQM